MTEQQRTSVERYVALIADFVSRKSTPTAFEKAYLSAFKTEEVELPSEVFLVLDRLFADVDAYCGDPGMRGPSDIGDDELNARAWSALGELRRLAANMTSWDRTFGPSP
jgi:hypothetical protein